MRFLSILYGIIFVAFLTSSAASAQVQNPKERPAIVELKLDRERLLLPCPNPIPEKYRTCPNGMVINVQTKVGVKNLKGLRIEYKVSGGQIKGSGPNIVWDLTKAMPGTYLISANVYAKTTEIAPLIERRITVMECPDCHADCFMPEVTIKASKTNVQPGENLELHAIGVSDPELKFQWDVANGRIISGQGTPDIVVEAQSTKNGKHWFITVTVSGDIRCWDVYPQKAQTTVELVFPKPESKN